MANNLIGSTAADAAGETQTMFTAILDKVPSILGAIFIIVLSFFIAGVLKRLAKNSLATHDADDNAILMVGKVAHAGTMILGVTIALKMIGIDVTSIVGLFGVGIGFALQDVIKNFVSGALILIQKPFHVGDVIQVGEYLGKIESIETRATNIRTFNGQRVIIPNADVFSMSVTNYSAHPERRLELVVGVDYSTDLAEAGQIVMNILKNHESTLDNPSPVVNFTDFGDSSINISAKFWVQTTSSIFAIRSNILQKVKIAFDQASIGIPFPITTLKMDDGDMLSVNALEKQNAQAKTFKANNLVHTDQAPQVAQRAQQQVQTSVNPAITPTQPQSINPQGLNQNNSLS